MTVTKLGIYFQININIKIKRNTYKFQNNRNNVLF